MNAHILSALVSAVGLRQQQMWKDQRAGKLCKCKGEAYNSRIDLMLNYVQNYMNGL